MSRYAIPGVAVGMLHEGTQYVRGYGVTNVDYPTRLDGDTVFRVASNTKTFTGTAVMRLVEQGKLDLDAKVRRYLPDFRTPDPSVTATVTVRHLLNHTAGWFGDYILDTDPGDNALAGYPARFADIPQLTRPGAVFSYNNTALYGRPGHRAGHQGLLRAGAAEPADRSVGPGAQSVLHSTSDATTPRPVALRRRL